MNKNDGYQQNTQRTQSYSNLQNNPMSDSNNLTEALDPEITISNRSITDIPSSVFQSSKVLTTLTITQTKISTIPRNLTSLELLTSLVLTHSNLKQFENACGLTKLTFLDLSRNQIEYVPKSISLLQNLESLILNNNAIKYVHPEASVLTNLKVLDISENQIPSLPFDKMENLTSLNIADNKIEEISPGMLQSKYLSNLDISKNKISLFPESISAAVDLKHLNISSNRIQLIPSDVFMLTELINLNIRDNVIQQLNHLVGNLVKLKTLDLGKNQMNTLPHELASMKELINANGLKLDGNPFKEIPNEIKRKGVHRIINFIENLKDKVSWRRMKVVFVGQENVGKTSLMKILRKSSSKKLSHFLKKKKKEENLATDGIDIKEWIPEYSEYPQSFKESMNMLNLSPSQFEANKVIYSTWDFAGQDVYYPTHQFFMSSRSIYLIVFNMVDLVSSKVEYWLEMVKIRSGKTAKAILVGTHKDDKKCDKTYIADLIKKLKRKYGQRFPFLKTIIALSTKTGSGLDELKEAIFEQTKKESKMQEEVPIGYIQLENAINHKKKEVQYMSSEEFKRFSKPFIKSDDQVDDVLSFFHDVGLVTYLSKDNKTQSDGIVVLEPQWIADLFSSIISLKHNYVKNGILETGSLRQLWKDYDESIHENLLFILKEFEICHPLSSGHHLIPCMLPNVKPNDVIDVWDSDWKFPIGRSYTCPFIPHGFFGRLLFRLLQVLETDKFKYWGNAFTVDKDGEKVLCLYNDVTHCISVEVRSKGAKSDNRLLLQEITRCIDTLIDGYYRITPKIYIPCPHCIMEGFERVHEFTFEECVLNIGNSTILVCKNGGPKRIAMADRISSFLENTQRRRSPSQAEMDSSVHTELNIGSVAPDLLFSEYNNIIIPYHKIELGQHIATGGFANLYKSTYNGRTVAVKKFHNQGEDFDLLAESYRELQHETLIMSKLKHPNLVELLGICVTPLCMVMEFLELGSLENYLRGKKKVNLSWPLRVRLILNIARGAAKLHENDIVHRDLRSPNILVVSLDEHEDIVAKLADFGLSTSVGGSLQGVKDYNEYWTAPEVMEKKPYNEKADIYSFAIVMWELLQIGFPYEEFDEGFRTSHEKAVIEGRRPSIPDSTPRLYADLIRYCWDKKPEDRPSFDDIIEELERMQYECKFWD